MSEPFHGVLPALITPFTDDGEAIDAGALAALVDRLVGAGVGGLVPGGSTGEFTTLDHAERRLLVEETIRAAAGRVPVVAGTGALSTRETVALSVHAEQAGAAAVMVVPPFYDPLPWHELLAHYTAVADAISIPVMYYNLPGATGVTLTAEQLRALPVTCLKDTGGDAVAATELIQTDGPVLLNGYDTLTFAGAAVPFTLDKNHSNGYTVGAGVEYMFAPNWSAKAEYMYYDFGSTRFVTPVVLAPFGTFNNDEHTLKLGVNYRFNFAGARY